MKLPAHYFPQAARGGDLEYAEKHSLFQRPEYAAQVKFDGARYIIHKDEIGRIRIYSRQISKKTGLPPDKTLQLQHLADEFASFASNGTVIDGEVVAPVRQSTFNLVTTITGSSPEKAYAKQSEHGFLRFQAFDVLALSGRDMTGFPLKSRHQMLATLLRHRGPHIRHSALHFGEADKRALLKAVLAEGGEGIILKDINATYYQGERHRSWVKVKVKKTFDVVFMGIQLAEAETIKKGDTELTKSRIAGMAGAIRIGQYMMPPPRKSDEFQFALDLKTDSTVPELREIGTVSGFDDAVRADITANAEKYAAERRVLEVTAQGRFKSGALQNPRFNQWRNDKNDTDCVLRDNEG